MPRNTNPAVPVTLLVTLIVAQGLLALLPHHHTVVPDATAACEHPVCTAQANPHLGRDALTAPPSPCLACAAHGVALSNSPPTSIDASVKATGRNASNNEIIDALPLRWQPPFRGPPQSV